VTSRDEVLASLRELGFDVAPAETLASHFLEADALGRRSHGTSRIAWIAELPNLDPRARPERVVAEEGFERWEGRGALGYLTLAAIVAAALAAPPERARVVVAADCFPTGVLGIWVRRLAEAGFCAWLTATSPARLAHPDGGPPLTGTNPIAIAVPSSDGRPLVADVSMGKVTHGDVLAGGAAPEDLVPFGGEQAHKAFALAVGIEVLVGSLSGPGHGVLSAPRRPRSRRRPSGVTSAQWLRPTSATTPG
jgi:LDH2 family malate/lactate/ureidoglycolate dehydrogenase